ncbi:hypothetical protein Q5P01_011558 [Channa striata]|uniref:Uncharacterized protein n=1 Tax=Channa striata TaxID=64152 RepID=A0AA88MV22_CHASR|nr:hypothetical protein Q5P01_011558 [Channa striata]
MASSTNGIQVEENPLHKEVMRLSDQLKKERNWRIQLSQHLDETKQQLARQKSLKEMYINKEKELKSQLEMMEKYADAETLSTSKIAAQVRDNIKQKKKKVLQKDYEELKVAYTVSQEKLTAELQKAQAFKEELDQLRASYEEVNLKYDTTVLTAKQQVDNIQQQLEKEIKCHTDREANDHLLIQSLRAEMDGVYQKMAGEIEVLKLYAADKETVFLNELEQLKTQLSIQISLNFELKAELEAERKMARCECKKNQGNHSESCKQDGSFLRVDSEPEPTEVPVEVLNTESSLNLELSTELTAEFEDHLPLERNAAECEEQQEETSEGEQETCMKVESLPHVDSDPEPMQNIEVSVEVLSVQTDHDLQPEGKTAECEEQQESEFEGKAVEKVEDDWNQSELFKQEGSLTQRWSRPLMTSFQRR